jgi:hypothetical protein
MDQDQFPQLPKRWIWTRLGDISGIVDKINPWKYPNKEFIYLDIASINNQQQITNPKRILEKMHLLEHYKFLKRETYYLLRLDLVSGT